MQTVCALRFFYRVTLGRPAMREYIAPPRRPFTLPTILSQAEVAALLTVSHQSEAPRHPHHALCGGAAGARTVPVAGHGHGQRAHGPSGTARQRAHDRYVMLSPKLLPLLRQYWQQDKAAALALSRPSLHAPDDHQGRVSCLPGHVGEAADLPKEIHPHVASSHLCDASSQWEWL